MKEHGLTDLLIRLTGNVVLAPREATGDTNPQTESDLALAQTVLRRTADGVLGRRGAPIDGAKAVRAELNALPRNAGTTDEKAEAARAEGQEDDHATDRAQHAHGGRART